jgi:hypothetical protein
VILPLLDAILSPARETLAKIEVDPSILENLLEDTNRASLRFPVRIAQIIITIEQAEAIRRLLDKLKLPQSKEQVG